MKKSKKSQTNRSQKSIREPSPIIYYMVTAVFKLIGTFLYQPMVKRSEIRNTRGSFVIIANHQSALDVALIPFICNRRIFTVFSTTYYLSLPKIAQRIVDLSGGIHKHQFQTSAGNMKKMRNIVRSGYPLLIFPAGLMCEDGLANPAPKSTASFLRWLGVDVYMAKITGSYFVMPKWSSVKRPGKTIIDCYKLFSADDFNKLSAPELEEALNTALDFDVYQDQENNKFEYKNGANAEGLENVLYQCPHCNTKYSLSTTNNDISCSACGFSETMDSMGFLHCEDSKKEVRHVSQWSSWIRDEREKEIHGNCSAENFIMKLPCEISILDGTVRGFRPAGKGSASLTFDEIILEGTLDGQAFRIEKNLSQFPMLPFVPGKRFEIQDGELSYRCIPDTPSHVTEFVNTLRILHQRKEKKKNDVN